MHQGTFRNVQPIRGDIEHVNRIRLEYTDSTGICFRLNLRSIPRRKSVYVYRLDVSVLL